MAIPPGVNISSSVLFLQIKVMGKSGITKTCLSRFVKLIVVIFLLVSMEYQDSAGF